VSNGQVSLGVSFSSWRLLHTAYGISVAWGDVSDVTDESEKLEFCENKVHSVLVEHCGECNCAALLDAEIAGVSPLTK
jgi:hypothetical protein